MKPKPDYKTEIDGCVYSISLDKRLPSTTAILELIRIAKDDRILNDWLKVAIPINIVEARADGKIPDRDCTVKKVAAISYSKSYPISPGIVEIRMIDEFKTIKTLSSNLIKSDPDIFWKTIIETFIEHEKETI